MKTLACLSVLVLCSPQSIHAQTRAPLQPEPVSAATRQALEDARDRVWRAYFAGDSVTLEQLIPAALAAGSRGGWQGREASLAGARASAASGMRLTELRFDSTSIELRGSVAVVRARFKYILASPAGSQRELSGVATEIFVRQDGRWVNPFWYLEGDPRP